MSFWPPKRARDDGGYAASSLLDVIVRKTAAMQRVTRVDDMVPGEALLPTVAALALAGTRDPLRVIDFGGAAGFHYRVARQAFPDRHYRWAVIETAEMATAPAAFADNELRFFDRLESGSDWLDGVDLMHCVSALQYVPEPETSLAALLALRAGTVMWAKLMLGDRRERFTQVSRLKDNGPGPMPDGLRDRKMTYTATRMATSDFLAAHDRAGYRLAWKSDATHSFLFVAEGVVNAA